MAYTFVPTIDMTAYSICPSTSKRGNVLNDQPPGAPGEAVEALVGDEAPVEHNLKDEDGVLVDLEAPGFKFYGVTYNQAYIGPNGYVRSPRTTERNATETPASTQGG
eukprot:476269-Pyramimonas_sp.AAC.1